MLEPRHGQLLYVTDPICSACWAMEPAWRRFLFHYGERCTVRYIYGGLLPNWESFSNVGAGVARPADVAQHWDDVARRSGQPIDASVWQRDPVSSSYPASVAAHAVRLLAPEREASFLRRVREEVFLHARNIARAEVLAEVAAEEGIDSADFALLYQGGMAEQSFRRDLSEAKELDVREFPTVIFRGQGGQQTVVHGTQPYARLERLLLQTSSAAQARRIVTTQDALATYGKGTTREFAELFNLNDAIAAVVLKASGALRTVIAGDAVWSAVSP